jgi:hypothetical protein
MAEMQKQDETKVDATTHASVTTKNKNPWMMMQAPLSKAAFQVSGSSFRHEQITQVPRQVKKKDMQLVWHMLSKQGSSLMVVGN